MGPFLAFGAIWAIVIALHSLQVLYFYAPLSLGTTALIAALPCLSWVIFRYWVPNAKVVDPAVLNGRLVRAERFRDWVAVIAVMIFLFEFIIFGGVPIWWMMTGEPRGYADFGIPTLHGIFNAMLLFLTSSSGVFLIMGPRKWRNGAILLAGMLVMAALYSRAMLVITLIQIGGILLLRIRTRFTALKAVGLVAVTTVGLFGFGVVGNLRSGHQIANPEQVEVAAEAGEEWYPPAYAAPIITTTAGLIDLTGVGYNPFVGMLNRDRAKIFEVVPTEFLWAYAYITSGYNNLLFNLTEVDPTYSPDTTFSKLVPTIVYAALGREKAVDTFERAHPAFTVSTAFAGPISDFGIVGFLFAVPLLVGASAAYQRALTGSPSATLLYAMLFQSILLTPYVDTVFYTTFFLQMLLALLAGLDFRRLARSGTQTRRPDNLPGPVR